jgi:hypothetical protein
VFNSENGFLANKIDSMREEYENKLSGYEKKLVQMEEQNKTMTQRIVKLHSKLHRVDKKSKMVMKWAMKDASTSTVPNMGDYSEDWMYSKLSSDYDTLSFLETPNLNLDVMLRFNTMLVSFLEDENREQLYLPMIGPEERAELSKLASAYKIRCRFGKETKLASVTLIKVRQSCLPAPGEVDSILTKYVSSGEARSMRSHSTRKAEVKVKAGISPGGLQSKDGTSPITQSSQPSPSTKPAKPGSKLPNIAPVQSLFSHPPSSPQTSKLTASKDPRQPEVCKLAEEENPIVSLSQMHTPLYCKETVPSSLHSEPGSSGKGSYKFPPTSHPSHHRPPRKQQHKEIMIDVTMSPESDCEDPDGESPSSDEDPVQKFTSLVSVDRVKGRKSSSSKQRQLFGRVHKRDSSDSDSPD